MNRCDSCEYYDECEYAGDINFCEDCKECSECTLYYVSCKAGFSVECNNGFEEKSDCYDNNDEEGVY